MLDREPQKNPAKNPAKDSAKDFVISRVFSAPRELVWRAFTEPQRLQHWFGPAGTTIVAATMDLRPGGTYHYSMRTPDGGVMWGKFVYREVDASRRLVWVNSFSDEAGGVTRHPLSPSWPLEMLTVVTFDTPLAAQSGLTIRWSPINPTEAERKAFDAGHDSMRQGWGGTLDRLAAYLAAETAVTASARQATGPEQAMQMVPYLSFNGKCEAAFKFYEQTLRGKLLLMMRYGDSPAAAQTPAESRDKIMHARLAVGDALLMGSDAPPQMYQPMQGVSVSLSVKEPGEAERIFAVLAENGAVRMPIQETFWAQRFGMLTDRFGTAWMINCDHPS
jgi:uncharacterized glyoxalase superfamily protein PhnB/uncharacterized protein YndB with AHSA1/START domain